MNEIVPVKSKGEENADQRSVFLEPKRKIDSDAEERESSTIATWGGSKKRKMIVLVMDNDQEPSGNDSEPSIEPLSRSHCSTLRRIVRDFDNADSLLGNIEDDDDDDNLEDYSVRLLTSSETAIVEQTMAAVESKETDTNEAKISTHMKDLVNTVNEYVSMSHELKKRQISQHRHQLESMVNTHHNADHMLDEEELYWPTDITTLNNNGSSTCSSTQPVVPTVVMESRSSTTTSSASSSVPPVQINTPTAVSSVATFNIPTPEYALVHHQSGNLISWQEVYKTPIVLARAIRSIIESNDTSRYGNFVSAMEFPFNRNKEADLVMWKCFNCFCDKTRKRSHRVKSVMFCVRCYLERGAGAALANCCNRYAEGYPDCQAAHLYLKHGILMTQYPCAAGVYEPTPLVEEAKLKKWVNQKNQVLVGRFGKEDRPARNKVLKINDHK